MTTSEAANPQLELPIGEVDVFEQATENWKPDASALVATSALRAYLVRLDAQLLTKTDEVFLSRSYEAGTTASQILAALGISVEQPDPGQQEQLPDVEDRPVTFQHMVWLLVEDSKTLNKTERTCEEAAVVVSDLFALAGRIALHNKIDPTHLLPEGYQATAITRQFPSCAL